MEVETPRAEPHAGLKPQPSCPTLLTHEREILIRYLRETPAQRRLTLAWYSDDPKCSGTLLHAMRWLFTA